MDKQKIALVTGGSKGIGAAIALTLAQDGFEIWLNYRSDHEGAAKVSNAIEQAGGRCRLLPFDVSNPQDIQNHLQPLLENETPYALINNAGFTRDVILAWMTQEEWTDVLSVTLGGFFQVTKPVINDMLRKREGRIINIASTSGQSGMAGQTNYSAAKAGLIGATKALAAEVGKRNILVNAVSPGFHRNGDDQRPSEGENPAYDPPGAFRNTPRSGRSSQLSVLGQGLVHHRTGDFRQWGHLPVK